MSHSRMIVMFDGSCNLCNGLVRFIIPRDPQGHIQFCSLQSKTGQALLQKWRLPADFAQSVVVIEQDQFYLKSTAALRIARQLDGAWPLLYLLIIIPRFVRDPLYDWIARNRYRWFGIAETCMLPRPEDRKRFLE